MLQPKNFPINQCLADRTHNHFKVIWLDPKTPTTASDYFPMMEGSDLRQASKTWGDLAASECRLHLMVELMKLKVGFADVEEFSLSLNYKYKSESFKNNSEMHEGKIVKAAMECKILDETIYNSEIGRKRNLLRKEIYEMHGKDSGRSKRIIKKLRKEAQQVKKEAKMKYEVKLNHL